MNEARCGSGLINVKFSPPATALTPGSRACAVTVHDAAASLRPLVSQQPMTINS